ncbi:MAG: PQQ-dependent sugar dehydrogenase, partial [Gammaproteobacteria bacterium]|nr:PQQ-dependent sugar dehydrogenase [Gammaproteobacteria bacterium]
MLNLKQIVLVLLALTMPFIASCGGGGAQTSNNPPPPVTPPTVGLDSRPSNTACVAPAKGAGGASVDIAEAFPDLPNLSQPVKFVVEPGANPRWFVLEKGGRIVVFDPDNAAGMTQYITRAGVVSTTANEGGLLGMALHPDYPTVPEIFLSYTIEGVGGPRLHSIISRVTLDNVAAPGAGTVEEEILRLDQFASNHNGGDIAFGADRLLYIGFGDGGGGGDPRQTAQDTTQLLGSMLRIDVIGTGTGYNIPADNPFVGNAKCGPTENNANNCPEIYAWGLRNPWRWSFDPPTGELWLGDVGQNAWEEVDLIVRNGNYGWSCREGAHNYPGSACVGPIIEPVSEYPQGNGNQSITGGYVYRGTAIPALAGRYVFGDFVSGRIWALQSDGMGGYTNEELAATPTSPSSFGVGHDGELYFTDYAGRIMRLVNSGGAVDPVPDLLSASGCVDPGDITQPYSGLLPYDINAPFWSDGAAKDRYIGVPNGQTISIDGDDDWVFPPGSVLVKNFRLNGRLIETRHLMRHPDGEWAGYTYEWDVAQTEATRVRGGKVAQIDGQDWVFPDEAECLQCHTDVAGVALGPETSQLN